MVPDSLVVSFVATGMMLDAGGDPVADGFLAFWNCTTGGGCASTGEELGAVVFLTKGRLGAAGDPVTPSLASTRTIASQQRPRWTAISITHTT